MDILSQDSHSKEVRSNLKKMKYGMTIKIMP